MLVSTGHAFGYTSIALDDQGNALVSWLSRPNGAARILLRQVSPAGAAGPVVEVAKGTRRSLGYPRDRARRKRYLGRMGQFRHGRENSDRQAHEIATGTAFLRPRKQRLLSFRQLHVESIEQRGSRRIEAHQ